MADKFKELKNLDDQLRDLKKQIAAHERELLVVKGLDRQIEERQNNINALGETESELTQSVADLKLHFAKLKTQVDNYQDRFNNFETTLNTVREDIANADAELSDLAGGKAKLNAEIESLTLESGQMKTQHSESWNELQDVDARVFARGEVLEGLNADILDARQKLIKAREERNSLIREIDNLRNKKSAVDLDTKNATDKLERMKSQLEEKQNSVDQVYAARERKLTERAGQLSIAEKAVENKILKINDWQATVERSTGKTVPILKL